MLVYLPYHRPPSGLTTSILPYRPDLVKPLLDSFDYLHERHREDDGGLAQTAAVLLTTVSLGQIVEAEEAVLAQKHATLATLDLTQQRGLVGTLEVIPDSLTLAGKLRLEIQIC